MKEQTAGRKNGSGMCLWFHAAAVYSRLTTSVCWMVKAVLTGFNYILLSLLLNVGCCYYLQ